MKHPIELSGSRRQPFFLSLALRVSNPALSVSTSPALSVSTSPALSVSLAVFTETGARKHVRTIACAFLGVSGRSGFIIRHVQKGSLYTCAESG